MKFKLPLLLSVVFTSFIHSYTSFHEFKQNLDEKPTLHNIVGEEEVHKKRHLKAFPKSPNAFQNFKKFSEIIESDAVIDYFTVTEILQNFIDQQNHIPDMLSTEKPFFKKGILFENDTIIQIVGDQHANGHDTIRFLDWAFGANEESPFEDNSWKLKEKFKNHHWVFAGDITDSGAYGIESLCATILAYLSNPNNIHIIRGNHEKLTLNKKYGFHAELNFKYGVNNTKKIESLLEKVYKVMPVAMFAGFKKENYTDWTLICHGGFETNDMDQIPFFDNVTSNGNKKILQSVGSKKKSEYQWNDFIQDPNDKYSYYQKGRELQLSKHDTIKYFNENTSDTHKLSRIIRAHQHAMSWRNLMPEIIQNGGMSLLWNEENPHVVTLAPMPCSAFGIPKYLNKYPGIIHLTSVVLTSETLLFVQLPNKHIIDWAKTHHEIILDEFHNKKPSYGLTVNENEERIIKEIPLVQRFDELEESSELLTESSSSDWTESSKETKPSDEDIIEEFESSKEE